MYLLECPADGEPGSWPQPVVAGQYELVGTAIELHHFTQSNGSLVGMVGMVEGEGEREREEEGGEGEGGKESWEGKGGRERGERKGGGKGERGRGRGRGG